MSRDLVTLRAGEDILVRDAFGFWLEKRALTGCMRGGDFGVVWTAWRDDPPRDDYEEGAPWPIDAVRFGDDPPADEPVLSHDGYRERFNLPVAALRNEQEDGYASEGT